MRLSSTMQDALKKISEHGDLRRLRGGFWTYPDCPEKSDGVPAWSVALCTIRALYDRNLIDVHKHERGYWIRATLKETT